MSYPILGEVRLYGGMAPPDGWVSCDGQMLPVAGNEALFALLSVKFGGDGVTSFGVPDLRGHVPLHFGAGRGLSAHVFAEVGGSETATISPDQLPPHTHQVYATTTIGNASQPGLSNMPAVPEISQSEPNPPPGPALLYAVPGPNPIVPVLMQAGSITPGANTNSEPHENRMPLLAIRFMIAVEGITPVRPQTEEA